MRAAAAAVHIHASSPAREKTLLALRALAEAVTAQLEEERAIAALPPADVDVVLALADAADELGEPITTVRARCQRGEIQAEKRGKLWKISRAELARYRERSRRRARRSLKVVE